MSAMLDYMQLCRLCLVKEKVNVPIFGDENDVRQIFLKITACLPVKVAQEDNLPKKICDACLYKVDLLYQFWNTTVNAEKQLIQWLTEIGVDVNIKNSDTQTLPILPQSHAHPHSMPIPIPVVVPDLKQERPDIVEKQPEFQMPEQGNLYSGFDTLGYPQAEVTMEVGAANTFVQPEPVEDPPPPDPPAPTPKKRGRPAGTTNKKSPPKKKPTPAPPVVVSSRTNSTRRSSATAAAAAVAAAAAAATDSEEDSDGDRLGGMDYDDSDSDEDHITKEEFDSDEDYVKPKSFIGVPSSADGEQPGPSGLGAVKGEPAGANATESGPNVAYQDSQTQSQLLGLQKDKRRHSCPTCDKSFLYPSQLRSHREQQRCGMQCTVPLQCDVCNLHFKTPHTLQMHKRRHTGDFRFTCVPCNKGFVYSTEYKVHMASKHEQRRFKCEKCDKTFVEKYYYRNHLKSHDEPSAPLNFQCTVEDCGKRFASKEKLRKHSSYHHGTDKFICQVCGKIFTFKTTLNYHMQCHSDEKPFVCTKCGKAFRRKSSLKTHQRVHEKARPFACTECDKSFVNRAYLKIHLLKHSEEPFKCDLCPLTYASMYTLQYHRDTEHGVPLHKQTKVKSRKPEPRIKRECTLCASIFHSRTGLLVHMRTKHENVLYPCSVCGKKLSSKMSLRDHCLVHTGEKPFACDLCDKSFNKRSLLAIHVRVHTGARPFKCTVCGKTFTQCSSLTIHSRYHTGERPYPCSICEKKFITKTILNSHIKSKHSDSAMPNKT